MGSSRTARRRRPSQAAISSRAVSRTRTAASQNQEQAEAAASVTVAAPSARQTSASSGKKAWTRISTPIQRPSGIDQPRMSRLYRAGARYAELAMRIIAGTFRSRTLEAPAGLATRPTSDRLRETLFNVLAPRIAGAHFLDLYAGSGAVGMEALSRGAAEVEFVERAQPALRVLRENLARLGVTAGFRIHGSGVGAVLRKMSRVAAVDVVFLDPPYDAAEEYAATLGLAGQAWGRACWLRGRW